MLKNLCDHDLINTYKTALRLHLDDEFILILKKEIERRGLNLPDSDRTNGSPLFSKTYNEDKPESK